MSKILIIEDDRDIADLIAIHMNDNGHEATKVHDGQKGLLKAMETQHDLIILDLKLPGMDGLEICHKLRLEKIDTATSNNSSPFLKMLIGPCK